MILSKRILKVKIMLKTIKNTIATSKNVLTEMGSGVFTMLKLIAIVAIIAGVVTFGLTILMFGLGITVAVLIGVYVTNMKIDVTQDGEKVGTWCRKEGFVRTYRI